MPPDGELELARQRSIRGRGALRAEARGPLCVWSSGQLTKMNAPFRPEPQCSACATASLPAAGRTDQQQRLGARRLPRDRVAKGANRRALADERAVHAAARLVQEIFGDAQLALERRRPFRDARFERRIGRLQRLGGAPPLVVELRVADRAGDLVRDDRHQAAIVLVECLPHRALDREHPTSSSRMRSGIAIWLSAFGKPGTGTDVADFRVAAGLHHLPPLRRRVGALLSEIAELQHLPLLRDDADGADADADAAADRLVLVAAAGDDAQRLAAGLDEQNDARGGIRTARPSSAARCRRFPRDRASR